MHYRRHLCLLVLLIFPLLSACPNSVVTYHGQPITDPALAQLATALHTADVSLGVMTQGMLAAAKQGIVPIPVVAKYHKAADIANKAISNAATALGQAIDAKTDESLSRAYTAILAVTAAMQTAADVAREYGL